MKVAHFFSILETASSEVSERNFFTTRSSIYIPDFFIVFFYLTIFCFSVFFEVIILFFIIFNEKNPTFGIAIALTAFLRVISELFVERKEASEYFPDFSEKFLLIFNLMGLRSILLSARILKEISNSEKIVNKIPCHNSFPIFHISNENLSLIKIYCCVAVIVKCIPQIFMLSAFVLDFHIGWPTAVVATINILLNMVLFSFTISATLPVRKTPRIFTTSVCLLFNAFNKFMATWCACCLHLAIFALVFRSFRYYALIVYFFKCAIWMWPCWQAVKSQVILLPRIYLMLYVISITLVFGFIYIHPFEGKGNLHYYFFYLLSVLSDLAIIYTVTEGNPAETTSYVILRIIMTGFLCGFGLFNFLHTCKMDKNKSLGYLRIKSVGDEKIGVTENRKIEKEKDKEKVIEKEEAEMNEIDIIEKKNELKQKRRG